MRRLACILLLLCGCNGTPTPEPTWTLPPPPWPCDTVTLMPTVTAERDYTPTPYWTIPPPPLTRTPLLQHTPQVQATPTAVITSENEPLWIGWATFYIHGEITRSGEDLDLNAYKCAVDDTEWAEYAGALLQVCDDDNCIECRVNDSGYLYDAGLYRWFVQKIGQYWVSWWFKSETGYRIVVDLTPRAYNELNPRGLVEVRIVEEE